MTLAVRNQVAGTLTTFRGWLVAKRRQKRISSLRRGVGGLCLSVNHARRGEVEVPWPRVGEQSFEIKVR
jgi:hypothetical protein